MSETMNIGSEHESQLPWTGERYVPEVTGEIQLEHVHRLESEPSAQQWWREYIQRRNRFGWHG